MNEGRIGGGNVKAEANAVTTQYIRANETLRGGARPSSRDHRASGATEVVRESAETQQSDSGRVRQTALLAPEDTISPAERFYQRYLDASRLTLTYRLDPDSGDLLAEILERYGREEIRQIPPEHVVAYAARFNEWLGYILDVRV